MNVISDTELKDRLNRLRKLVKEKGLNGIIVYSDEYRSGYCTYFTGYKPINVIEESLQTLILMEDEEPILVIGRLNYYSAKETVWIDKILQHHKFETEISDLLKKFNKKGKETQEVKTISYPKLVPYLVDTIQVLTKRIEELEKKVK